MKNMNFKVSSGFYLILTVGMILIPLKWLLAWSAAIMVHELCHYIALRVMGIQVERITVNPSGIYMSSAPLSGKQMTVSSLAGPIGSLVMLFGIRHIPRIALCAAFHAMYNLLPIYPLDGGRALWGLAEHFLGHDRADIITDTVKKCTGILLLIMIIVAGIRYDLGIFPVFLLVILFLRNKIFLAKNCSSEYNSGI